MEICVFWQGRIVFLLSSRISCGRLCTGRLEEVSCAAGVIKGLLSLEFALNYTSNTSNCQPSSFLTLRHSQETCAKASFWTVGLQNWLLDSFHCLTRANKMRSRKKKDQTTASRSMQWCRQEHGQSELNWGIMQSGAYLSYGFINGPEGRLFVVVVDTSVAMQYVNATLLGWRTIAAVDAVIWAVIPLARKLQQAL